MSKSKSVLAPSARAAAQESPRTMVAPVVLPPIVAASPVELGRPNLGPICHICGSETVRVARRKVNHPFVEVVAYKCSNAKCREQFEVKRRPR